MSFINPHQKKIENEKINVIIFFLNVSCTFANTLRLPLASDVTSLDPRVGSDAISNSFIGLIYESLFAYDSEGNVVPGLCESWETSEDGLSYTFYLRDSFWGNGDPCTAYDFEYAWKKCCDPKYAERATYFMYPIKNAELSLKGGCPLTEVGIKALNSKTLKVDLEAPTNYLFEACASCSNYKPISKKMDQDHPDWIKSWDKHLVTNGAFKIKSWKKGFEIILEKNDKFWNKGSIRIDDISLSIIPDHMTAFLMFEKGKLDWVGEPLGLILQDCIDEKGRNQLSTNTSNAVDIIAFNTLKHPFNNKNFRKAVSYAFNRQEISDYLFPLGSKKATTSYLNGKLILKNEGYFEDGNEELAKEYFQKALKEMGKTSKECSFIYSSRSNAPHIGEILQEKIRKLFGVQVELRQKEFNVHFSDLRNGNYQMGEVGWTSYMPDELFYLSFFLDSKDPLNLENWESETFKYLFNKGRYCSDPVRKKMYYQLAEEHMIDEMPFIPLFQKIALYKTNPKLKGYYFSPGFYLDFKNAYFEE